MSIITTLAKFDKRYAWSFFGFVLAAILGGVTIYTEFYRDTNPEIKTEIITNASILDIKEDIANLQIIYQDEDIRKSEKNLSSLLIKISNTGRSPILISYYDDSSEFGLQVFYCEILKAELVSASNDYLINKLEEKKVITDKLILPKMILEPNDNILLKFLLMHPENQEIKASPIGKIARTKFLKVQESYHQDGKQSFFKQVFSGTILVHITRLPIYIIIIIITVFVVFMPPILISEFIQKRSRKKNVKVFKKHSKLEFDEDSGKIFTYYISNGLDWLNSARKLLVNEQELSESIAEYREFKTNDDQTNRVKHINELRQPYIMFEPDPVQDIRNLIKLGLIELSEESYDIKPHAKLVLDDFVEFILIKQS